MGHGLVKNYETFCIVKKNPWSKGGGRKRERERDKIIIIIIIEEKKEK